MLPVLGKLGVQVDALRATVEQGLGQLPVVGAGSSANTGAQPGAGLMAVLRSAEREAAQIV